MTTSKSICPALTFSARSSNPTMSAPAAFAASAFLPCVNTATRTVLPVPCGITVEPRTCWSDLVASTPKLTETSTDSLNFAVANSLTSLSASSIGYDLPGGSFSFQVLVRLATAGMSHPLRVDAHAAGAAGDRAHGGIQTPGGQIGHLHLGDVFELLARDLADLGRVGRRAAFRNAERLGDQHRGRRRLHDERETAVAVDRDHDRRGQALLQRLGLGIECLAELHDVHALLTQCRANRRARIGLTCRDLQLDVARNFLRHLPLLWVLAPSSRTAPLVNALTRRIQRGRSGPARKNSTFLHLREIQLDGRRTPENLHRHLQAILFVIHRFDDAVEVVERAVGHTHDLAGFEQHLGLRLVDALFDSPQNRH